MPAHGSGLRPLRVGAARVSAPYPLAVGRLNVLDPAGDGVRVPLGEPRELGGAYARGVRLPHGLDESAAHGFVLLPCGLLLGGGVLDATAQLPGIHYLSLPYATWHVVL